MTTRVFIQVLDHEKLTTQVLEFEASTLDLNVTPQGDSATVTGTLVRHIHYSGKPEEVQNG